MASFLQLKGACTKQFGEIGAWVFDEWEKLNETLFDGKIIAGPIVWGKTPEDRSIGYYLSEENLIHLHTTLVRPLYPKPMAKWDISNLNKKFAGDVLLHEMIHQMIHQTGGWEGATTHNNKRFVGEINRIAELIGLGVEARVIKQKEVDGRLKWHVEPGCMTYKEMSEFPYSSRPNDYYFKEP
ncbi:MAG: hypothetical protein JRI75_06995 [Deltaproteobacteria bacterium]|nr:hypothetical protein [Deltaproteobacteria bacterium]